MTDSLTLMSLPLLQQVMAGEDEDAPGFGVPTVADLPRHAASGDDVDWDVVDKLRSRVVTELPQRGDGGVGDALSDPAAFQEFGRKLISEAVAAEQDERVVMGRAAWRITERERLQEAIFDSVFRLGRLQPLVDNPTVENIIVMGHDRVTLQHTDGSLSAAPPVARDDEDLVRQIQFLVERQDPGTGAAKSFSPAHPVVRMTLGGGARMTAKYWVTPVPTVVIRRHRLVHVTLDDLVDRRMFSPTLASFIRAAVRARLSIVVAGPQSSGKTTLMRAICAEIPPSETIATFESQYELFLHHMPETHPIVHAWESSEGTGEVGADGRLIGAFSLTRALESSMADFIHRMIVGEVVGNEIWALIKAAESGSGAMCTTHGRDAIAAVEKLVTCAMEYGPAISADLAVRKLTQCVDLVVQVSASATTHPDGTSTQHRWISEVVALEANPDAAGGFSYTHVFGAPGAAEARAGTLPDSLRRLEHHGFDLPAYVLDGGTEAATSDHL